MRLVEIGLQRDRSLEGRADIVRRQARLIGENPILVTQLRIGDACINGAFPCNPRAFRIAFV